MCHRPTSRRTATEGQLVEIGRLEGRSELSCEDFDIVLSILLMVSIEAALVGCMSGQGRGRGLGKAAKTSFVIEARDRHDRMTGTRVNLFVHAYVHSYEFRCRTGCSSDVKGLTHASVAPGGSDGPNQRRSVGCGILPIMACNRGGWRT